MRHKPAPSSIVGLILLIALLLSGCSRPAAEYQNVSAGEALELIAAGRVVVIDVREPDEFAAGHIPGALLFPLGTLEKELDGLDREAVYLLVCRSGNRSGQAAELMIENGFTQVKNLRGGMNGWTGEVER